MCVCCFPCTLPLEPPPSACPLANWDIVTERAFCSPLDVIWRCDCLAVASNRPRGVFKICYVQHLLDRIAITLSADVPPTFDERVKAVEVASRFQVSLCREELGSKVYRF